MFAAFHILTVIFGITDLFVCFYAVTRANVVIIRTPVNSEPYRQWKSIIAFLVRPFVKGQRESAVAVTVCKSRLHPVLTVSHYVLQFLKVKWRKIIQYLRLLLLHIALDVKQ